MKLTIGNHELDPVYAILTLIETTTLQGKTNLEIFTMLQRTHPNDRYPFMLIESNFDISIRTPITINRLMTQHNVDGFMIKLKDSNIIYNTNENEPFAAPAGYTLERINLWE